MGDSPQHFVEMLPYAIALNLENEWEENLRETVNAAIQQKEYQLSWYHSSANEYYDYDGIHDFSSRLNHSFSRSISNYQIDPRLSSNGDGGW